MPKPREKKLYAACQSCPSCHVMGKCDEGFENWYINKNKNNHCPKCNTEKGNTQGDPGSGEGRNINVTPEEKLNIADSNQNRISEAGQRNTQSMEEGETRIVDSLPGTGKEVPDSIKESLPARGKTEAQGSIQEHGSFTVYTDGGCAINPGGPGAFAAIIINNKTGEEMELTGAYKATTNNRMEMMGPINALGIIPYGSVVDLYSDSQYVIRTLNGEYSKKKNLDLWAEMNRSFKGKTVRPHWVKGHDGNSYNERCDALCTANMHSENAMDDQGFGGSNSCHGIPAENSKPSAEKPDAPRASSGHGSVTPGKKGAMGMQISIPGSIGEIPRFAGSLGEYARQYNVTVSCAKAISGFLKAGKRNFKAYMQLKTGGTDNWSKKSFDSLRQALGDQIADFALQYLPDPKDAASALRWHARGLSLEDSIRKVLVDMEVRANCFG